MFAFVALAWNETSLSENSAVEAMSDRLRSHGNGWRMVFGTPGLQVYCRGMRLGSSEASLLSEGAGVLVGTVFARLSVSSLKAFDSQDSARILNSEGRYLVSNYWGRYVAFMRNSLERASLILRSPTGEIDCLRTEIRGVQVYFSEADQCPLLEMRDFSINWDYVAADISTMLSTTRETGLKEIQRVIAGECVLVRPSGSQWKTLWNPASFVTKRENADPGVAAVELYRTTHSCIRSWASCYKNILANLSGGLDSSILISMLHDLAGDQHNVTCINYRNAFDTVSDERSYARIVANHCGYPLIEREQDANFSIQSIMQLPRRVTPWSNFISIGEATHFRPQIVREYKIDSYFTGHGGDQVFFTGASKYVCPDFVYSYGLRPRTIKMALDGARVMQSAVWPTLRNGLREGFRRDSIALTRASFRFSPLVPTEVLEHIKAQELFIPKWLAGAEGIPPGKVMQVITLASNEILNDPWDMEGGPEIVNPLLSQPLQELCLSIPTHLLALNARNRGLARLAFQKAVPKEILARRDKGAATSNFFRAIWASNIDFIRALLLDGMLVREKLVDRERLERNLANDFTKGIGEAMHIVPLIGTEAWLQTWMRGATRKQSAA